MTDEANVARRRELAGKVVLVTGGVRNIGRAIANALADGGASVMVNARASREAMRQTIADIEAAGGIADGVLADVSDPLGVATMVGATIERFGRLDALVHNAAVRVEQPLAEIAFADWRRIVGVILDGAFLCAQACAPHLARASGGSIVLIGGETGHRGAANRAHVVAAKAGVAGLAKALALELAPQRITVNCVVPGRIDTVREPPEGRGYPRGLPPLGRLGRPDEVAAMVRMLCGPDSRYVTGQAIHVNGGGYFP